MKSGINSFMRDYWVLILIVAAKFALQYTMVNPYYELHRDEFLHLDQANHLAFGYISVPPLTSLISRLIFLLGGGEFWVRFFPALFGALTIILAWLLVEELGGKIWSKLIVSLALLFSVLLRLNILFQPNSIDILIWTLIFYALVKFLRKGETRWLWYLAVFTAIGFYNKYNIIFLLASLAAGLILTPHRKIFAQSAFWKVVLFAILLILPNIIWQIRHDFPVIDHMRVLKTNQLDNNSAVGFIQSQVMIFFGSLPLTFVGLAALLFYKPFRSFRYIAISFIALMLLFTFLRAKDYYALGIYPVIFVFASVFLERILHGIWKTFIIPAIIVFNLSIAFAVLRFLMPYMTPAEIIQNKAAFERFGMLRWEDGKNHQLPQDFSDMTGWKEMADKALEAYRMIPENELDSTLVFCNNYGQAGALNYYNRGKMKEAFSFNTDYIYWLPGIPYIKNVILVGDMPEERVAKMFNDYRQTSIVENEFAREKGTRIFLFTGADPAFTEFFYNEADRRKKELDIF